MNMIRHLREINRLSQEELAKMLTVSQTTVSKWDLGKSLPDIQTGIELSRLFKVSLDVIYNNPYAPTTIDVRTLTEAQQRVLDILDKIQEEPDKYEAIGVFRQAAEKFATRPAAVKKP